MLVVKLPETGEEVINDKLTDTELKLLSGTYNTSTNIPGQHASLSWYPSIIKFKNSGRNTGRWTEVEEREFSVRHSRHTGAGSNNASGLRQGPLPAHKWKNSLRGSSDVHLALSHINKQALLVIEGC
ncbi:hypothetical protein BYT27DRAFT_7211688 [Phlegmacium glaucopus]|nr:hypothetical protein BYT27DRAFT_7211688 [Phlegmacium glaucopus]